MSNKSFQNVRSVQFLPFSTCCWAIQILWIRLLSHSSKLSRNPIWQLLIFCCSDENVRTIDALISLQKTHPSFHLRVNQKSKSHPDAPIRRLSNEIEPTHGGAEALLAEWSFASTPTIFPHVVMNQIKQTRVHILHKRNDPVFTQKHFVQACMHAYSITNQLVPYITWTQTYSSHRLYANTQSSSTHL